jgi:chemotaxis protein methyltransferase CheR
VLSACPDADALDIRILGTDVDPAVLPRAARGRYPAAERAAIPDRHHDQLVDRPDGFEIGPRARALLTFGEINLAQPLPLRGPCDVILCRNVVIYFDPETQVAVWDRLADRLAPGGVLMIGHSERIRGPAAAILRPQGDKTYEKVADGSGTDRMGGPDQ